MPLQRGRGGGGGVSRSEVVTGRWRKPPAHSAALNMRDALHVFLACAVFRIFNAFAVRTYFNADEFWQALEVWKGGGHPTMKKTTTTTIMMMMRASFDSLSFARLNEVYERFRQPESGGDNRGVTRRDELEAQL